ncbi:STAS domain-containing protein [Streptomyces venezuelae]|uniref:STAS domain-containing protein n=1 Tax=Streptomyces venezuelae TaxID=54571 RepID=UPI0037A0A852
MRPNPQGAGRLNVQTERLQEQCLVRLTGEIDLGTVPIVYEAVHACLDSRPSLVIISLVKVSFCDCAGLRALLQARQEIVRAGAECRMHGPLQPPVASLLAHTSTTASLGVHGYDLGNGPPRRPPAT